MARKGYRYVHVLYCMRPMKAELQHLCESADENMKQAPRTPPHRAELEEEEDDEEDGAEGHPECASQEDCIWCSKSRMVQHLVDGDPGDVYCEECWQTFLEHNPSLVGEVRGSDQPLD